MVEDGCTVLTRLAHRSAYVEKSLGDGIGIHTALPDEFFRHAIKEVSRSYFV